MNVKLKSTFCLFAGKLRTISVIILLAFTFSVCHAQTNSKPTGNKSTVKKQVAKEEVFEIVEEFPEFPGGDEALKTFIAKNVVYPQAAKDNNIVGTVWVKVVIAANGKVKNPQVWRNIDPLLDEEALKVVKLLPTWKPGKQRGQAVNVYLNIKVNFYL